jgi:adhesin transport system outer membrane protein
MHSRMPRGAQNRWQLTAAACSTALVLLSGTSISGPVTPVSAEPITAYAAGDPAQGLMDPCAQTQFAGAELDCAALRTFGANGIAPPQQTPAAAAMPPSRNGRTVQVRLPDNPPLPPRRTLAGTATHVTIPQVTIGMPENGRELPSQRNPGLLTDLDPATGRSEAKRRAVPQTRVAIARSNAPRLILRTEVPVIGPLRQRATTPDRQPPQSPLPAAPQAAHIQAESVSLPVNPPAPPHQTLRPAHRTQIAQAATRHTILPTTAPLSTGSVQTADAGMLRSAQTADPAVDTALDGRPDEAVQAAPERLVQRRAAAPVTRPRVPTSGTAMSLDEAIDMAVRRSPKVGLATVRSWDAYYGVNVARSARRPQVDGSLNLGQQTLSTERQSDGWRFIRGGDEVGYARFDAELSLRQLIYDFGESRRSISQANHTYFSQRFRMISRIDEVATDTISAYLNLMEQRTLITAAEENLQAHVEFEELVRLNEANGNGTQADVERIVARRIDAQTLLTDLEAALEDAADQLERLTRVKPGPLAQPRSIDALVPRSSDHALAKLAEMNPDLLSIEAARQAAEYALESHRAKNMPRVEFELTGRNDNYFNSRSRSELDVKSMLTVRHRFSDGGKRRNEMLQLEMRVEQEVYRYQDARIELEADIRRLYRAIKAANDKTADLEEGLTSSRKVRELYTEQFREGGRTLFELLDAQQSLFNAIRERTANRYTRLRAQYQLLKTIGTLGESVYAEMGR